MRAIGNPEFRHADALYLFFAPGLRGGEANDLVSFPPAGLPWITCRDIGGFALITRIGFTAR